MRGRAPSRCSLTLAAACVGFAWPLLFGVELASTSAGQDSLAVGNIIHERLGQATLRASNDTVYVENIGASGSDGVAISARFTYGFTSWSTRWTFPEGLDVGAQIIAASLSPSGGAQPALASSLTYLGPDTTSAPDDRLTIFATAGGDSSALIACEVLQGSAVVAYVIGPPGNIAVRAPPAEVMPNEHGQFGLSGDLCPPCDGHSFRWDSQVEIALPGETPVLGEALNVYPAAISGPYLTQIQIVAVGAPSIALSSETLSTFPVGVPTPSPGSRTARLESAWPNPASGTTRVRFTMAHAARVILSVHDAAGRFVRALVDGERVDGSHEVIWDGTSSDGRAVSAGVYIVRLAGDGGSESIKVIRVD